MSPFSYRFTRLLLPDRLRINQAMCCLEIFKRERLLFFFAIFISLVSNIFSEVEGIRSCIFAVSEQKKCLLMWTQTLTSNKSCNSHQEIIKIHILPKTYGNTNILKCSKGTLRSHFTCVIKKLPFGRKQKSCRQWKETAVRFVVAAKRRVKEDSPVSFTEVSSVINKREAPGWSEKSLFNV